MPNSLFLSLALNYRLFLLSLVAAAAAAAKLANDGPVSLGFDSLLVVAAAALVGLM